MDRRGHIKRFKSPATPTGGVIVILDTRRGRRFRIKSKKYTQACIPVVWKKMRIFAERKKRQTIIQYFATYKSGAAIAFSTTNVVAFLFMITWPAKLYCGIIGGLQHNKVRCYQTWLLWIEISGNLLIVNFSCLADICNQERTDRRKWQTNTPLNNAQCRNPTLAQHDSFCICSK